MQVFGCTWKINFPEIIFSWPSVLKALTRKWFEVKIFTSNHFRTHAQRESLRLRLRWSQPSTSTSPIYDPTDLRTDHAFNFANHSFDFVDFANLRTDLQPRAFDPRTFDFVGDLEPSHHKPIFDPSPSTQSHEPTNRSLSMWFWFFVWFWLTHKPMSLWSLILLLLRWCWWWCFGGFSVVRWWVLCGWWWKIAFLECYQTHENIF